MGFVDIIWRKRDLASIGPGITFLGVLHWEPGMLFIMAPDVELKKLTGSFPKSIKGKGLRHTHPLFVLETRQDLVHRVCPCTSKPDWELPCITAGCKLEYTDRVMNRTSYIVKKHSFLILNDLPWISRLRFLGKVPEECIKIPCRRN
ncbi:MAG: hypothetical protein ACP5TY_04630 [Thermodesulforhabdaceae bacterium]|jgi:hypothetical protein